MLRDHYCTVGEAASIIGVTPGRVRQLLKDNAETLGAENFEGNFWLLQRVAVEQFAKRDRPRGNPNWGKSA